MKILYRLPKNLRDEMRRQIGLFFQDEKSFIDFLREKKDGLIVSIGDIVTLTVYRYGIKPNICIVDFQTKRGECSREEKNILLSIGEKVFKVENPPGILSKELWVSIEKSYELAKKEKHVRIEVDGEDDLASLPAIYLAPVGTTVIYGMPDKGISLVEVNMENKKQVENVLKNMKR